MAETSVHQALNECILERDTLAESHTELIAALESFKVASHGHFSQCGLVHSPDRRWRPNTQRCIAVQAALTKARELRA